MVNELIAKLFAYKKEITYGEDLTLYLRIPGDQVVEDTRTQALLESRKLRRALRNVESDEYLLHIDAMHDLDDDELVQACTNLASRDVMRDFVNTNPRPSLGKLGDYPTQEEQEEQAIARIEREEQYFKSMQQYIDSWRDSYLKGLKKQGRERALVVYAKLKTDRVCEELFSDSFEEHIITAALYTDETCTKQAFTAEEYRNLPTAFRTFVKEQFSLLSVTGEDIKKS